MSPLARGNINTRSVDSFPLALYIFSIILPGRKKNSWKWRGREMIGCGIRDETFVWILDGSELR